MARRQKYIFSKPKKSRIIGKAIAIVVLAIAVLLLVMFIYANLFGTASKVHTIKPLEAEINTDMKASDLITSISDGGKLVEDKKIDTSATGKVECPLKIDFGGKIRDYSLDVEIVDTKKPEIGCPEFFTVIRGSGFNLEEQLNIKDNSGKKPKITVDGECDPSKEGEYEIKVVAEDKSGNRADKKIKILVIDPENAEGSVKFVTEKGYKGEIKDGILKVENHIIVNRCFGLPEDWNPGVSADAEKGFSDMRAAAAEDGFNIFIMCGYRNLPQEKAFFENMKIKFGDDSNKYFADPDHSEGRTGEAFDLNSLSPTFGETAAGKWLNENCWKYGYIIRYPKGEEKATGYDYVPWHVRYVGNDLAKKLYNDGKWISLESYYGIPSDVPKSK